MSEAEKKGRAMLSAVGQSISDDTMVGVEKSIGDAQRNMAVDLNQTVDNFNNFSSARILTILTRTSSAPS